MGIELNVTIKELKAVCDEVSALGIEGVKKLKTVAIFGPSMALNFIAACKQIGNEDESKLSEEVIRVFNILPSNDELKEMVSKRDAEKGKKPEKKGKGKDSKDSKPKKDKPKVDPKPKSRYGHIQSAKSGKLDDALFEGGTMEDIMSAIDIPRPRFQSHVKHLKDDLGLTLVVKPDKDKNSKKDHYKVKEESLEKK